MSGYFSAFQFLAAWGYIFGCTDLGWPGAPLVDD